jgi:hypothetical protein
MFRKKSQAAMEFLMTYGWAILVVLVAIGALAYFGVLSPDKFLPERCTGPAGMDCLDKAVIDAGTDTVTFVIKNNLGYEVEGLAVTDDGQECSTGPHDIDVENDAGAYQPLTNASNGRKIKITLNCASGEISVGRFKDDVKIQYTNTATGLTHSAAVSITGAAK